MGRPGSQLVRGWFASGSQLVRNRILGSGHLGRGCFIIRTEMEEEEEQEEEEEEEEEQEEQEEEREVGNGKVKYKL